ncbi:hypothetical protein BpHYR1_045794 [Brachionus plicatilis]|uniref:Uncharacterized protein n=1 Tax=Brachionus plicatilis TaxID=10195 RepID=A0A3M7P7F7_BRAPC|nr:hypothetical protein BpHYR1_045794 [Brachionus plicatilis]
MIYLWTDVVITLSYKFPKTQFYNKNARGKSLENNVVHLIISVTLIQVMHKYILNNSLETTEEALQSIDSIRSLKVSVHESVNEHTHLDNSEKNMSPEKDLSEFEFEIGTAPFRHHEATPLRIRQIVFCYDKGNLKNLVSNLTQFSYRILKRIRFAKQLIIDFLLNTSIYQNIEKKNIEEILICKM